MAGVLLILVLATSLIAVSLTGGVVFAYARLLRRESGGVVFFFASSQVLVFGGVTIRVTYWALRSIADATVYTPEIATLLVVLMLNLLSITGTWCALQATYLMIPERERSAWSWYSSPLYPVETLPRVIRFMLFRTMRR